MQREMVILTKSRKYYNYCVAGIDLQTGEWIRLISEDESIHNAVRPNELIYETGEEAEILDKVTVVCEPCDSLFFQPENHIIDTKYYLKFNGRVKSRELLPYISERDYIFYDNNKKIHKDELKRHCENESYSLLLINPKHTIIDVKTWPNKRTVSSSFKYNNTWYNYLRITDHVFEEIYLEKQDGRYKLENDILFVISLGEVYNNDDCHYKLIASIIDL